MEDFKQFCAYCKYPNLSKSILNKRLSCRYKTDMPFLKLSPLKMEELNLEPLVALFHDVISDADIEFLIDAALPNVISGFGSYCSSESSSRISTSLTNFTVRRLRNFEYCSASFL